jgi:hypothetical protein
MITNEGILVMLEGLIETPMELRLYTNRVKGAKVSVGDFEQPMRSSYKPRALTKTDWTLNVDDAKVTAMEVTFDFASRVDKIVGWFLVSKSDESVVAYEPLDEPYTAYNERFKLILDVALKLRPEKDK